MPWMPADADKHYKGLDDKHKRMWAHVANSALTKCEKEGGSNCDASAIQQANGVVSKAMKSESLDERRSEAMIILSEAGRMISAKNATTLASAMKVVKDAMAQIESLINAESESESDDGSGLNESEFESAWSFEEAAKILAQDDSFDARRTAVQLALRRQVMSELATAKMMAGEMDMYDGGYNMYPWIRDLYDAQVVYCLGSELYQRDYSMDAKNVVTLGDATPVQVSYVPVAADSTANEAEQTSILNQGEIIVLQEKAVKEDGTVRIKLISPGWGSSGYYSANVLERDGPKVFPKGTHMYVNHPTEQEDEARPERDLRDLAGVLTEDAQWMKDGPTGPGLYATASVLDNYRGFIDEAAPYIGTSIRAGGKAVEGQAEGRYGMIVEGLTEGYSVDYVTKPGRGGQVLPLLESARSKFKESLLIEEATKHENGKDFQAGDYAYTPDKATPSTWKLRLTNTPGGSPDASIVGAAIAALGAGFRGNKVSIPSADLAAVKSKVRAAWKKANPDKTDADMPDAIKESERKVTEEEIKQLREANEANARALSEAQTQLARMSEAMILRDARDVVHATLASIELPDMTRARLSESCAKNPPTKDGALDRDALVESVKEAAKQEIAYITSVVGVGNGAPKAVGTPNTMSDEDADRILAEAFSDMGFSESAVKTAIRGRE